MIDAYLRVSVVGIELLTVDARVVIASVDTYLRFAEATNRLDLYEKGGKDLTEAIGDLQDSGAAKKTSGAIKGAKKAVRARSAVMMTMTRARAAAGRGSVSLPMPDAVTDVEVGCYVYGVVLADADLPTLTGIDGTEVEYVAHDGIAAAVGEIA